MNKEIRELDEMLEVLNEAEEDVVLTEVAVYRDTNDNIYIGVYPDDIRMFYKDPYFKISWKPIKNNGNTPVARISMRTGDYVIHNRESVELKDDKLIAHINEILLSNKFTLKNVRYGYTINNVWEALLYVVADVTNTLDIYESIKAQFPYRPINPNPETLKKASRIIDWGRS